MFRIFSSHAFQFCQAHTSRKVNPRFMYPFEFTNLPQKFQLHDPRFYEQPIGTKLYPKQKQHLSYVLHNFCQFLNKGKIDKQASKFIHESLLQKTGEFREILKTYEISANFIIKHEKIDKNEGYLQYHGLNKIIEGQKMFIQDYQINRKNQKVVFAHKTKPKSNDQEKKQTLKQQQASLKQGKQVLDQIKSKLIGNFEKRVQATTSAAQFINKLSLFQKKKEDFEKYYYVDRIHGSLRSEYTIKNKKTGQIQKYQLQNLMVSKWLYLVDRLQSQDIIQSRKRVLFDFQLWNRGCFIPNRQYVSQKD